MAHQVRIGDISASGVELSDDELTGIAGGLPRVGSLTIGGNFETGAVGYDCDAPF